MPIITRIYRTGSQRHYTVLLDCGHKYVVENAMVKRDQLYVGKGGQACIQCDPAHDSPPLPDPGPVTFATAWELSQAIDNLGPDLPHPHSIYVRGPKGETFTRFRIHKERLTDGSHVYDLVLEGD